MWRLALSAGIALLGTVLAAGSAFASNLYVTNLNDGAVSQYAVASDGTLSPLSPAVVPAGPGHSVGVAIGPDGKSVYVANITGSISQYDVGAGGSLSLKSPASVPAASGANGIAISPDGKSLYVADFGASAVSQFDVGPGGALAPKAPATVTTGSHPDFVAVSPDGKSVYVSSGGEESTSQFDVGAGGLLAPKSPAAVPAGESPEGIAISPDGKSVYVANYGSDDVSQYDVGSGGMLVPKSPATVPAGEGALGIAVSPDGSSAYVGNDNAEFVSQFGIAPGGALTPKSPPTAPAGEGPDWIAIGPSGRSVYASDFGSGVGGGGVSQYDVGSGGALAPKLPAFVAAGNGPAGVAITPDQPPVASFSVSAPPVRPGVPVAFDASASRDSDGSIATYAWSFGDGQAASGGPTVAHTYSAPGTYGVNLTLTDNEGCSTALIFAGQTAYCNGSPSATASQTVSVAYPGVRVKCHKSAKPRGCKFKLQAVAKKPKQLKGKRKAKAKPESALAVARLKPGHSAIVSLKPKQAFAAKLAVASKVLVKETVTIRGTTRTSYRKLKVVN